MRKKNIENLKVKPMAGPLHQTEFTRRGESEIIIL